jgi:SAM-dependent methyltransferase
MIFIHSARKTAEALGLYALAWKLRKLDFPIGREDLVLDVGSGAAPNPYANILLEYDPSGRETNSGAARANGKLLLWGDVQRMPFRDRVFDFVTCFHVLEHVPEPAKCLNELQRVAKRGYLETPNEIFDYVVPYHDHQNRVSFDGETLRVVKKDRWNVERFVERFGKKRSRQVFDVLISNPANLHVTLRWDDRINFAVSDEVIRDGAIESGDGERESAAPMSPWVNALATRFMRRRPMTDDRLLTMLRCVRCESTDVQWTPDRNVTCKSCGRVYARVDGCLDFRPT